MLGSSSDGLLDVSLNVSRLFQFVELLTMEERYCTVPSACILCVFVFQCVSAKICSGAYGNRIGNAYMSPLTSIQACAVSMLQDKGNHVVAFNPLGMPLRII